MALRTVVKNKFLYDLCREPKLMNDGWDAFYLLIILRHYVIQQLFIQSINNLKRTRIFYSID